MGAAADAEEAWWSWLIGADLARSAGTVRSCRHGTSDDAIDALNQKEEKGHRHVCSAMFIRDSASGSEAAMVTVTDTAPIAGQNDEREQKSMNRETYETYSAAEPEENRSDRLSGGVIPGVPENFSLVCWHL